MYASEEMFRTFTFTFVLDSTQISNRCTTTILTKLIESKTKFTETNCVTISGYFLKVEPCRRGLFPAGTRRSNYPCLPPVVPVDSFLLLARFRRFLPPISHLQGFYTLFYYCIIMKLFANFSLLKCGTCQNPVISKVYT